MVVIVVVSAFVLVLSFWFTFTHKLPQISFCFVAIPKHRTEKNLSFRPET